MEAGPDKEFTMAPSTDSPSSGRIREKSRYTYRGVAPDLFSFILADSLEEAVCDTVSTGHCFLGAFLLIVYASNLYLSNLWNEKGDGSAAAGPTLDSSSVSYDVVSLVSLRS